MFCKLCSSCSFISDELKDTLNSVGILVLRLSFGGIMLVAHGWGKLTSFVEKSGSFPDPFGVSPQASMALAISAEVFCAFAIVLGIATRLAAIPLMITMAVAAFIIHANDPWMKKEFPLLYLFGFTVLVFTGGGKFSVDGICSKKSCATKE